MSSSGVVVIATPWDAAYGTATSVADDLDGKVVICMANALTRIGKEFQPLVPPRGSVAASVQAAVPGCRVSAGFHHVPAKELGDLDHPIEAVGRKLRGAMKWLGEDASAPAPATPAGKPAKQTEAA